MGSMEALIAHGWYESAYGRESETVYTEYQSSAVKLYNAQKAFHSKPTPVNEARLTAAQRRYNLAYQKYEFC